MEAEELTREELEKAADRLRSGRATSCDGVTSEAVKPLVKKNEKW